ncbi:hypothetical protein JX265_005489 [Neoarthrinium moseri]|uniref:Mucin n=1 Tax=Neoarthrinium moseri TaxID=1658444 RepID=A0A9P9WNS1_9PEZI|nr:uncharacterized protein JN550_009293 [Neoarthrinium moseri]KAI1847449.1 hypothetical protein JX266_006674 [Neoarthrinium moseri]KAI1863795.1 hypothetical protein JN550_009293 [Neoarthrinium moseri]KAI1872609.1 hypothetical protein JX265_005489 [Neoarthrinium moseri]
MESQRGGEKPMARARKTENVDEAFLETFKWMDEEEDLDLRLHLDDYHANLRDTVPVQTKDHRPSFRRHLSINKIPFGRASVSSSRPTVSSTTSTPTSPTSTLVTNTPHARRKSRALSLIQPRHIPQESTGSAASFDPAAAHYQDPEARLKLRVYLASPQKFDEAVQFGFPSNDVLSARPAQTSENLKRNNSRRVLSEDTSQCRTFFSDDQSSTYSEDISLPDPESPRTPHSPEKQTAKPQQLAPEIDTNYSRKISESYAQAPAASREMTLRMTLTRPDLRACEDQIYGWQSETTTQAGGSSLAREELPPRVNNADSRPKESFERFFASLDEEESPATNGGVVKRMWNKMRRS